MESKIVGTLTALAILTVGFQASAVYKDITDGFLDQKPSNIIAAESSDETGSIGDKIILKIGSKDYVVNGVEKTADTAPEIIDDRTMVPVRLVSEAMAADVTWDEETRAVTIKKDDKKIVMQVGSTKMKIGNTEVALPVPPQVNKDSRTIVPVRAISEAFGSSVIWNGETQSIYIGYTQAEADALEQKVLPSEDSTSYIDPIATALNYIAGGKFQNPESIKLVAITDNLSGAVVSFSDSDFKNLTISIDQSQQDYIDTSIVGQIRSNLHEGDFVYVMGGEAYVFNPESKGGSVKPYINRIAMDGKITRVFEDADSRLYGFESIVCDKDAGICLSDGYKINYKYDPDTDQFVELDNYTMLGTAKQRMQSHIESLAKLTADIDQEDVEAFGREGNTDHCRTIRVFNDSKGDPALCAIIGGQYGLRDNSIDAIDIAICRLNLLDPTLVTKMCNQYGLNCITGDLTNHRMLKGIVEGAIGTFDKPDNTGVIYCKEAMFMRLTKYSFRTNADERVFKQKGYYWTNIDIGANGSGSVYYGPIFRPILFPFILVESRGIYDGEHTKSLNGTSILDLKDKICDTNNLGVEKQAFALNWLETVNKQERITKFDEKRPIKMLYDLWSRFNDNTGLILEEYARPWQGIVVGYNYYATGILREDMPAIF